MRYLITGGSGYFGGLLKRSLLNDGHTCINLDIDRDLDAHPNLISLVGNVADQYFINDIFSKYGPIDCVFHAAAQLQLNKKNKSFFYATNIDATRYLAEACVQHNTRNLVYISSNCVYGKINGTQVSEENSLHPFEAYGQTKVASENILQEYRKQLHSVIFRPPTIVGEGRLGILSIVFDFIRENRKIWLVGSGENRYQFIYGDDLVSACKAAAHHPNSEIFNIGCDNVPSLNELFQGVIDNANSQSKIYHLPAALFIPAMKLSYKMGISPLGPYQYNMIANTFIGDTSKVKRALNWQPTKSNIEMLSDNYHFYTRNYEQLRNNKSLTGHRKIGRAGIINLIKLLS